MTTTTKTPSDLSITTTEHPNAARMRASFEAFAQGDLETVRAHFADDATWTNNGSSALAGTFRGWEEISAMFFRLFEITGGTHRNDLISVLADDRCAVAVYDATSTVAGQTRTMRSVIVDDLDAEGRVTAAQLLFYDQDAADAHLAGIPQPR